MFKINSLTQIETMSGLLEDKCRIKEPTVLARAVYRELRVDEPETPEELFKFYQNDPEHEHLMEEISTELSKGVMGLISKVQNELLDLVDTTFEEVRLATKDDTADLITHRLNIIPEVKFLDSNACQEVVTRNVSSLGRMSVPANCGTKFAPRNSMEILGRVSKTMSADSFDLFSSMIALLKIDIVEIYDNFVRRLDHKRTPLERIGTLKLPYTHVEAVVAYHIVKSLLEEQDDETRLQEVEYNNYLSALLNNLSVRYGDAVKMLLNSLSNNSDKCVYAMDGDVVTLTVYEPILEMVEKERQGDRNDAINYLLSMVIVKVKGPVVGVKDSERYDSYRRQLQSRRKLHLSSKMVTEIKKSFESFVNSLHFNTWYEANYEDEVTDQKRVKYLEDMYSRLGNVSVGSDDELYKLIIDLVCEVFYNKPAISKFIGDIRIIMGSGDVGIHEAIGLAADRLIMKYLVDMVEC